MKSRSDRPTPSKSPANEQGGEIVELSRFRAELGRGRRLRRADAVLESPNPSKAVRALPGDEFYYVVHELGFPEAGEILQYATAEQVQVAFDFALWDRDQIATDRVDEWLTYMVEAPPTALIAWARGLDIELLALILRQRARIYDLSGGEEPEEEEGSLFHTPDGFFVLDLLGDPEQQRVTRRLCDLLYRMDLDWMRKILVGIRAEVDAELEEEAYRWRSGRMADLGFEDYYDALEVYRELDPADVRPSDEVAPRVRPVGDETTDPFLRMPAGLVEQLASGSPFARAVAGVTDKGELANLQAALVTLSNRVLAADRVTPGDDVAVEAALTRLHATLDLATEFLGRHDANEAVRAVRSIPLVRLHQLGASLIGKLRKLAETLKKRTPFARLTPPLELWEMEDAEILAATGRLRPMFPRSLETPPAPGERPFASLADLALATGALERAAASVALLIGLGGKPELMAAFASTELGADRDAGFVGRSLLVRRFLGEPEALAPLTPPATSAWKRHSQEARQGEPQRRKLIEGMLAAVPPAVMGSAAARAVMARWIEGLLDGADFLGSSPV